MSVVVFDTHSYVRQLHEAGFSEVQAEILIRLQQESAEATLEKIYDAELATKQDLSQVELALKHELKETELALKHDLRETELKLELKIAETHTALAQTKAELIRWVIGVGFLQTALISALLLKMSSGL